MSSSVLFVPLEDTYPVNSVDDFYIRSKLKTPNEILKYFQTVNERIIQDLRFHSDFFIQNLYPRQGQSYYILTTSSRIKDPICDIKSTGKVCLERINHLNDRRVIIQGTSWSFDSFTGEYLLGILANKHYPKGTLTYYGGYTCDNWNYLLKESRCLDFIPLQSQQGVTIGMYSLLLALKSIGLKMGELSWENLSINPDSTIKVGTFTSGSYSLPNGIIIQTGELPPLPGLGKRVLTLMLLNDKVRPYLSKEIEKFFQDFPRVLQNVLNVLPESRLGINVDTLLQYELNDNTPEIESYLRRCL